MILTIILGVLAVLCFVSLVFLILVIWPRNNRVYEYLGEVLEDVDSAAKSDIAQGKPWRWRYEPMDIHRLYTPMLWKFWRSFDSFFPDQSFRDASAERLDSQD